MSKILSKFDASVHCFFSVCGCVDNIGSLPSLFLLHFPPASNLSQQSPVLLLPPLTLLLHLFLLSLLVLDVVANGMALEEEDEVEGSANQTEEAGGSEQRVKSLRDDAAGIDVLEIGWLVEEKGSVAPPGLAVTVEEAAIASVGREAEVGADGGVTVHRESLVPSVEAARELDAVEHVGSQHVHDGGRDGREDAHHTQNNEEVVLQRARERERECGYKKISPQ